MHADTIFDNKNVSKPLAQGHGILVTQLSFP